MKSLHIEYCNECKTAFRRCELNENGVCKGCVATRARERQQKR